MTAHELAKLLLEGPDIEVLVYNAYWHMYDPISEPIQVEDKDTTPNNFITI